MVNRAALLVRYKQPAVAWINEADPSPPDTAITIADVNAERTVYLISDIDAETPDDVDRWIGRNYRQVFEAELDGWYTDPDLWPPNRTFELFQQWFDIECHTVLIDTVGGSIVDDDEI